MIKEKYTDYYTASGSYRKYLMKQESANTAEMYDYFSRLEIRCRQLLRCNELVQASNPAVSRMVVRIGEFISDMRGLAKNVFEKEGDNLHRMFADLYDESASVVEGFEAEASQYLSKLESLSESAQLIQRRTHFTKNHAKNAQRSNAAKMAWRANREKFKSGIKKFHASSAGKQFHRNMSRYSKRVNSESVSFTHDDLIMTAKGLSSCCTHIIIEAENILIDNAGRIDEKVMESVLTMREVFYIFNEALCCLVDAVFQEDMESVANVVDIIKDYYDLVGAGDKDLPDASGVDIEGQP